MGDNFQGEGIKADRIHMVDNSGNNYFFRGNDPFIGKGDERYYAHDTLIEYMNNSLSEEEDGAGPLDDDVYLVSISLLNQDERSDLKSEEQYYTDNPDQGEFIHWSVVSGDNQLMDERLQQVSDMLSGKIDVANGRQVAIYVHCDGGRDRTGYFVGSYRMDKDAYIYSKAMEQNVTEGGREMKDVDVSLTKSYCNYLESDGYANICDF